MRADQPVFSMACGSRARYHRKDASGRSRAQTKLDLSRMTEPRSSRDLTRYRNVLLAIAGVAAIALIVGAAATSASPRACGSCHAMRPYVDSLAKSKHARVSCVKCHVSGGAWGVAQFEGVVFQQMYPAEAIGGAVTGAGTTVDSSSCLACHAKVMNGRVTSTAGLRINHSTCVGSAQSCSDCHSDVAHGATVRWKRQPVMEECVICHRRNGAPTACNTCHAGKNENQRLAAGPWQITHGPNWAKTHGMGTLQYCSECHNPSYCSRCHGIALPHPANFGELHGEASLAPGAKCLSCHNRATFCLACHGMPMPHPADFRKLHMRVAKSLNDSRCVAQCHHQQDCDSCHLAHIHPGSTSGTIGKPPTGAIALPKPRQPK